MNSLQAMEPGKKLTIRTRSVPASEIPVRSDGDPMDDIASDDSVVVLEVQDKGTGITDEVMARIFEPFFTTKPAGEGTGLGLPVCKRIIELHHGELRVANVAVPRGLLVSILLKADPAARSA